MMTNACKNRVHHSQHNWLVKNLCHTGKRSDGLQCDTLPNEEEHSIPVRYELSKYNGDSINLFKFHIQYLKIHELAIHIKIAECSYNGILTHILRWCCLLLHVREL